MYAFIQMCRHKGKYTRTRYLCPCQMRTQIILTAHVHAAHPFVLWHLIWPLPRLYVFANCPCLFWDILRDRWGWRFAWASHRYTRRETGEEGGGELYVYFCVKVGKCFLHFTSTAAERLTYVFWAISANHSQFGSYLNIDECFPPLTEPYQNRPEQIFSDGERGKRGSGFIKTAQGSAMSWLGHLMENEKARKQNKGSSEEWDHRWLRRFCYQCEQIVTVQ